MQKVFTKQIADAVLAQSKDLRRAQTFEQKTNAPFAIQKIVLDLTTAKLETDPFKIAFPFKSVFVETATDTSTTVSFKPSTRDQYQSSFNLTKRDSWTSDGVIGEAYLHWDAQSAKSITLVFFVDAEFRSGSQISQNSGGVSINEGSSADATTRVTLSATTAAAIAPANSDRKVCLIENATGADLYISGANTVTNSGATRGIKIAAGDYIEWRNTAALYGYSVAGGDVHYLEQE